MSQTESAQPSTPYARQRRGLLERDADNTYLTDRFTTRVANVAGFSLHAGVATKANERAKLERLCRYITRPVVSTKRLSLTRNGQVRYELNQK